MIHVEEMLIAKILTQVNYLENFPIIEISAHFVTMFNVIKLEKQLLWKWIIARYAIRILFAAIITVNDSGNNHKGNQQHTNL